MPRLTRRATAIIAGALVIALVLAARGLFSGSVSGQREARSPTPAVAISRTEVSWRDSAGEQRSAIVLSPVAGSAPLPTLIFSPGFGQRPVSYVSLLSPIAAGGFIVIAVTHPANSQISDMSLFDAAPRIAAGMSSALDHAVNERRRAASPFARVDTARIGAIGHSVGGAAAALACAMDSRIRAGMDLDGTLYGAVVDSGVSKPLFLLMASLPWTEHFRRTPPRFFRDRDQARLHEDMFFARSPAAYWLTVDHLDHMAFTDSAETGTFERLAELIGLRLNAQRTKEITTAYAVPFFHKYLDPSTTGTDTLRLSHYSGTQLTSHR